MTRHDDRSPEHAFDKSYWEQHWHAGPGPDSDQGSDAGPAPGHGGAADQDLVNPYLVREVGDLVPGSALDAGCGAGIEAVWLASHGWQVTAADISATALNRAGARTAATETPEVVQRVQWIEADLETWEPGRAFDLVTTHYAHPAMPQLDFYERIASWVAPGGSLLVVGHLHHGHGQDRGHDHEDGHDGGPPDRATTTAAAITARLDPAVWDVVTADEVNRTVGPHGGREVRRHDVVVRAHRRDEPSPESWLRDAGVAPTRTPGPGPATGCAWSSGSAGAVASCRRSSAHSSSKACGALRQIRGKARKPCGIPT